MIFTKSASEKIAALVGASSSFRINAAGNIIDGHHIEMLIDDPIGMSDVTICEDPRIIANLSTINYLSGNTVDFDGETEEFIISRN